jgi:DNA recombination protein RmuC
MSLLRVVSLSWRQMEIAKNAQEISERGVDLYKRLLSFSGHIEKIGKGIHAAISGYDEAIGSLQKSVLPAARKFRDLQGPGAEALDLQAIDKTPRLLALSPEDEDELKKRRA